MSRSIKVLLLDDDAGEILTDLNMSAKLHRVLIKESFTNAKEGIAYIKENHDQFDAIILDGFFLANPESSKKKDITALKKTVDELTKILYKEGIQIPYCVLTGYLEDIENDSILSDIKVFRKGKHNKEMFDYLKSEVRKSEVYQIKNEFEKIFELFDQGLLPADKEEDLVEILRKLKSEQKYNDDDAFNPIRKMYEAFINELHDQVLSKNRDQDIVPEFLYDQNGNLSILWSQLYLSGKEIYRSTESNIPARSESVWPSHISSLTKSMMDIFQEGSHDYPEDVHHYTYKSVVFALLELLLWYKTFITNYNAEQN
ncbi:MAG: hypothetical protein MK198_03615 [Gracilimonas sp.]|uniref:hypothetical protein n=1 Tax=Gracilimonas sp. TaxID=1974203 RepID=UPI0037525E75|nr:hypothetical protein [Gracilimonas sp.]